MKTKFNKWIGLFLVIFGVLFYTGILNFLIHKFIIGSIMLIIGCLNILYGEQNGL